MPVIFNYYGVDWLAMALTFLAIYLLGNKSRYGFTVMMAGNASWFALGLLTASSAMIVANVVFFLMNLRGFAKWSPREPKTKTPSAQPQPQPQPDDQSLL